MVPGDPTPSHRHIHAGKTQIHKNKSLKRKEFTAKDCGDDCNYDGVLDTVFNTNEQSNGLVSLPYLCCFEVSQQLVIATNASTHTAELASAPLSL